MPTVIDHDGVFFMVQNFVTTLCTIISLYVYLFCAAFRVNPIEFRKTESLGNDDDGTVYVQLNTDVLSLGLVIMIIVFEFIFLIKMAIKSVSTYVNPVDS